MLEKWKVDMMTEAVINQLQNNIASLNRELKIAKDDIQTLSDLFTAKDKELREIKSKYEN